MLPAGAVLLPRPVTKLCRAAQLGALLALGLAPATARPAPEKASPISKESAAKPRTERELPELPAPPKTTLPRPEPKDLEELDARLAALKSDDPNARDNAARELLETEARLVAAIAFRIDQIAERADKEAMKRLFTEIRNAARAEEPDDAPGPGAPATAREKGASPDYVTMLLAAKKRDKRAYPELLDVVAMSRMLRHVGRVEAVRALIEVYVRFGEFLRIHVQRELAALGDRAVPALLEARRHPAEKINRWARRQLDALGRAVPSEAVQIQDPEVLADVLRAYGRTRDPDAARVIVSFANTERAVVREAARQAIALLGEVAMWQLKDNYETLVGKKPPRDWSWERTARELFGEFDRARGALLIQPFEAGRLARARGDLDGMRRAFDQVLAQNPRFEHAAELAQGYVAYAEAHLEDRPEAALEALTRAERLTRDPAEKQRLESLALGVRAGQSLARGVADVTLLKRALELDPNNRRARSLLDQLSHGEPDRGSERARRIAAGSIGIAALAAVIVLLRRRREPAPP